MLALIVLTIVCILTYTFEIVFGLAGHGCAAHGLDAGCTTPRRWSSTRRCRRFWSPSLACYARAHRALEVLDRHAGVCRHGAVVGLYLCLSIPVTLFQMLLAATITVFGIYLVVSSIVSSLRPPWRAP